MQREERDVVRRNFFGKVALNAGVVVLRLEEEVRREEQVIPPARKWREGMRRNERL